MEKILVDTPSVWTVKGYPFSQAVVEPSGRRVHLSGQVGWTPERVLVGKDDAAAQTDYALDNTERLLAQLGGDLRDVVALTMYYSRDEDLAAIQKVRGNRFQKAHAPASTGIRIAGFVKPELLVELTATAVIPEHRFTG